MGAPGGQPLAALGLHAASTSDSVEHSVYLGLRRALRPSALVPLTARAAALHERLWDYIDPGRSVLGFA